MPNDGLKYVHVCSEGKTLGKILQSLVDIRGDISDNNTGIEKLNKNVDELNKQINNGVSSTITKLKKRIDEIENGERPKTPLERLTKKEKIILGVALTPLIIVNGVWILRGIEAGIEFLIKVWPK